MKATFITIFSFIAISVSAQVAPQKFNYQAVARNSTGSTIINQAISVKVDIVDSNQTTILYTEIHNTTTNQFGLFSLQIGGGFIVTGTFSTINWGAREKYIRTSADLIGGTNYQLLGMSQLLSVPYSLYAAKTNLIAGTGISITNGNTISATGGGGSSQWTDDTYGINYSTNHVGIGTTSQHYVPLTVRAVNINNAGNAVAHFKSSDTWHSCITMFNGTTGNEKFYSFILSGPSNSNLQSGGFGLFNHQSNTWSYFTSPSSNYLGIGSTSLNAITPKSRLHVFNGDVNIDQIGSGIILKSPDGNCWRVTIDNSGNLIRTAISCPN